MIEEVGNQIRLRGYVNMKHLALICLLLLVIVSACAKTETSQVTQRASDKNICLENADCVDAYGNDYTCDSDLNQCILS